MIVKMMQCFVAGLSICTPAKTITISRFIPKKSTLFFLAINVAVANGTVFASPLTSDTILENGRTIRDLATLYVKAKTIRNNSFNTEEPSQEYNAIVKSLDLPIEQNTAKRMISLFLRGAAGFPLMGNGRDYIVFYNPVTDTALVTLWKKNGTTISYVKGRLLLGERLQNESISDERSRWLSAFNKAAKLRSLNRSYQSITSSPSKEFWELLDSWMNADVRESENMLASKRINLNGMGTLDEILPCGKQITSHAENIESLRRSAKSTNIAGGTANNQTILASGGMIQTPFSIRIYAVKDSPSDFLFAIADESKNCDIIHVSGIETLDTPTE